MMDAWNDLVGTSGTIIRLDVVALDIETGDREWHSRPCTTASGTGTDLPGGAIGTPMTYLWEGRQYIALTVGGGPRLVAFALPE